MMDHLLTPRGRVLLCGAALAAGWWAAPVRAQTVDQEFEFANKLVEIGFADYAKKLMDEVVRKNPDQAGRAKIVKAEGFIAARKFAEAEAVISEFPAGDPKGDAIRLALGRGYYRIGDMEKARQTYTDFFSRFKTPPSDADLLKFYREASFQFSQMLQQAGDLRGAADAIGRVLSTNPGREVERSLRAEQAQLLVDFAQKAQGADRDKALADAAKICADIQWGGVDLWFGQSIITLANIELVKGNRPRAEELINRQYRDILRDIDKMFKEDPNLPVALNPFAGARFLVGQMYEQDGDAIVKDPAKKDQAVAAYGRAIGEFYNVFVKYGSSDWGPRAGVRASEVKAKLEGLGKKVDVDLGAHSEKIAETQLRLAGNLFIQRKFAEASVEYLRVVNAYPDAEASIRAMSQLIQCYMEQGDKLTARALIEYVVERFPGRPVAATAVLSVAGAAATKKDDAFAIEIYEQFLRGFPKHDQAGKILFFLGGQRRKAGDNEGANHYFQQIVDNLPQDQFYPQALRLIARSYYDLQQYDEAIAAFSKLVADIPPSPDRANAQFSLADCHVRKGDWVKAAAELETLISWLVPKNNPYAVSEDDRKRNRDLLERAVFQRANCYARMTEPADQVASFRERGMRGYEQFLQLFPQSEFAPKAMMGQGQIQLSLGQFDAAAKTFDQLAAKYPLSEEGKNALYSLARSAMEIGQFDQARLAFDKMVGNAANYKPDEFTRIGQLMIDAKLFDQALQAFRIVSENPQIQQTKDAPESRALLERALFGVGRANFERKNFEEAIKALEQLLKDYPRSGLFYEVRFLLGQAYAELGQFLNASQAMSEIFRLSKDPMQINQASLTLAGIQIKANDKAGALASFQRIALLTDPSKPEQRPFIQEALYRSIPLAIELGQFSEALENCDQYLQLFPTSDKVPEVRRWQADAKLRASTAAPAAPAGVTP